MYTLGATTPVPAASPYQLAALDPGGGAGAGAYGHSLKQGMAPSNPYVYHSLDAAEAALAQQQERAQQHLSAYPFAGLATSETGWTPGEELAYSTDEFRMFQFKVYRCTKRFAHDWRTCPFAHPTENARRRDPNQYRYSATACPDYKQGFCLRGEMCPYSHGVFESWLHPSRYRTQLCKDGTACSRPLCFFAHSLPELRAPTHTWVPTSEDLQPGPQMQSPFALQPAQRSASQPPDTPGSPSQGLVQAAAQLAAVSLSNEDSSEDSSKPRDSVVGNAGPGPQPPRSNARAAYPRQPYKSHPHHHVQRGGGGGRPSPAHTAPSAAALGLTTPRMSNAFARRHGLNPKDNAMLNLQKIAIQQAQLANGGVPPHSASTNSGSSGGSARAVGGAGSKAGQHSSDSSSNAAAHKQSPHATAAAAANSTNGLLNSSSLEQLSNQQQLQQELSNAAALNHVAAAAANAAASLPSNGSAAAAPSPQSAAAAAVAAVAAAADQGNSALGGGSGSGSSATHTGGRLSNNGGSGASSHHSNSSHNSSLHLSNLSRDSSGPISAGSAGSSCHSNGNSSSSPLGMLPAGVPAADAPASASLLQPPSMATAAPPTPPLMHIGSANQAAAAAGATHGMMLPLLQPAVGAGPCADALLGSSASKGGASVGSSSAAQADAAALAALQQHLQAMSFAQPSMQEQQAQQQAQRIELQAQVQVQQQEQQAQQNTKLLQDYMHSIQQQQQSTY